MEKSLSQIGEREDDFFVDYSVNYEILYRNKAECDKIKTNSFLRNEILRYLANSPFNKNMPSL